MIYSNEDLWQRIRRTDTGFAAFTERGGTWRNQSEENPGVDVDVSKGVWKDFRSDEGGTLYGLARSLGAIPELPGGQDKQLPTPSALMQSARRDDEAVKRYFGLHRRIPRFNYEDLLHRFRNDCRFAADAFDLFHNKAFDLAGRKRWDRTFVPAAFLSLEANIVSIPAIPPCGKGVTHRAVAGSIVADP